MGKKFKKKERKGLPKELYYPHLKIKYSFKKNCFKINIP